jgi:murein DD-endopeptidase MepM/ murein hydrolase activator NlpD
MSGATVPGRAAATAALLLLAAACAGPGAGGGPPLSASTASIAGTGPGATATGPVPGRPARHLVLPGETLSALADRYGIALRDLAEANGLEEPYAVYAGQVLTFPARPGRAARGGEGGRTVTVKAGDTLAGIAARQGLKLGDVVAANPGLSPDLIRPGQKVRLPGEVAMPPAPAMSSAEVEAVRRASLAKPPSLSGEGFLWPVRGAKVVSRFGDKPDGTRNAGVNLAAKAGTPVLAAENGLVVYAGDKVPGYGRMLLIRHAGGFTTAYAHNQSLLVKVGERVRRGQRVATVGSTGGVSQPQLHFELREGSTPIDPQRYLEGPGKPATAVASSAD